MHRRLPIAMLAALTLAVLPGGAAAVRAAVPIDQLITLTARWTPIDGQSGTVTVTFAGVPAMVNDGFLIMNATGAMDTSGWHDGSLLSRCPQNSCNYPDSVSVDWMTDIHPAGSSGTYSFTAAVPPGERWYVMAYLQYRPTQSSPNHLATSGIVSFAAPPAAAGGGSKGPGGTTGAAVAVAEGYATVTHKGRVTRCSESSCPIDSFTVGDEVATGANSYVMIKSKGYGWVRVGPFTKFTIAEHFADLESGSIEYLQVQHQVGEHLYVAPLPALNYVGGKPKAYTAGVQSVGGANLDVYISTNAARTTSRALAAAATVTVDVIRGSAKVADNRGRSRVVTAGHEARIAGGVVTKATAYRQASCNLTAKGYGAFCDKAAAGGTATTPLPGGAIAAFTAHSYCCWSGAKLSAAWTQGGSALQLSWSNPGPRYAVSLIYLGTQFRTPGLLWPGDLWRHWWDPLVPGLTSFTLTRADYEAQAQPLTWALLRKQARLYLQVVWSCAVGYNDRQAGVTCGDPVPGETYVDLWSTLLKVPAG